jgi:hypothetical protein
MNSTRLSLGNPRYAEEALYLKRNLLVELPHNKISTMIIKTRKIDQMRIGGLRIT